MQKWVINLEKKFGRYAIPNLINYFIVAYVASTIISLFVPGLYYGFLALDFRAIMHGQVWRLITFILAPASMSGMFGIIFFIITINLYYLFGHSLENVWGAFRFNLFFFGGIILTILGELILHVFTGYGVYFGGMNYLYQSMFFAFCTLFPEEQFLIYFIFPLKAKYLAAFDALLLIVQMIQYLIAGIKGQPTAFAYCVAILVSMLNFLIFFYAYKGLSRFSPGNQKRRRDFQKQVMRQPGITKHKCAICGRTEESNPELSFRFCSKCQGNYEYCEDHIFTHKHVGYEVPQE